MSVNWDRVRGYGKNIDPLPRKPRKVCTVCKGRRYLIATRLCDGDKRAIERCDNCSVDTLSDIEAAALARLDGIECAADYPCYVLAGGTS